MLNRKLIAVPTSLLVLAASASGVSAQSTPSSGTTIVNGGSYSPSINQGASNLNCNGGCASTGTDGAAGVSGPSGPIGATGPAGISNSSPPSGPVGPAAGAPSAKPIGPDRVATQDIFILGNNTTNVAQALNNTQAGAQDSSGSGDVLIINRTGFAPSLSQGAANANCNGVGTGCGFILVS